LAHAEAGQKVELKVNKLWSPKTQLTYDYYSLPVCKPDSAVREGENIGQILVGDRIMNSDYQLHLGKDSVCNVLCEMKYSEDQLAVFAERIANEYTVNWVLDGLPAAVRMYEEGGSADKVHLERGFPLGFQAAPRTADPSIEAKKRSYIFNHIQFIIGYHQEHGSPGAAEAEAEGLDHSQDINAADAEKAKAAGVKYRIVGFEVEPFTSKLASWEGWQCCVSCAPPGPRALHLLLQSGTSGRTRPRRGGPTTWPRAPPRTPCPGTTSRS